MRPSGGKATANIGIATPISATPIAATSTSGDASQAQELDSSSSPKAWGACSSTAE